MQNGTVVESGSGLVPANAQEIWDVLSRLDGEKDEGKITFAIAGGLFLAGLKAGFYGQNTSGIDRYILFFKLVESIDPKSRFDKTFLNVCGRFVNYCDSKLSGETGRPNQSSLEAVRAVVDGLRAVASASDSQKARVMRALLRVRDASHLFVTFSYDWSRRFSDIDNILKAKFDIAKQAASSPPANESIIGTQEAMR